MKTLKLFVFATLALVAGRVAADSWLPPSVETTTSANGQFRVTVVPRGIDSPLAYFEDKVKNKELAGQRKGDGQTSPIARVEKLEPGGRWRMLWQKPLVNDVAPPSVLLANDASFLVTFDNWHSVGYGDDVVVIYDRHGNLVRKLSLEQILPPAYVPHLPRSVSSRWWGGKHRLVEGGRQVELKVVEPGPDAQIKPSYVDVRINLADGVVVPPTGAAWERALAKVNRLEAERQQAWNELRTLRAKPLSAPSTNDTREWRHYMFEIRDRIADDEEMMGGMVLAAPGADPGFHTAERISGAIEHSNQESWSDRSWIFASPVSKQLADTLAKPLRERKPGSMKGVHIVFVGTPEEGRLVSEAGAHAGAKITLVDRTRPYPPGKPLPAVPSPLWMPPPARF